MSDRSRSRVLLLASVLLLAITASYAQVSVGPATYSRAVTIDHRQVSNTDQTDFPVLISGMFPYLATVANGGRVQNAKGYDIEFTSDAAGQIQLDHEIDSYDPVTGTAAFWVRIPTLSHTTDTQIYMWYGNSAAVASQENKPGVWKNGYVSVYHFSNGTTLSAVDSLGTNSGANHHAGVATGMIGGAASFGGGGDYVDLGSNLNPSTYLTFSAWAKLDSSMSSSGIVGIVSKGQWGNDINGDTRIVPANGKWSFAVATSVATSNAANDSNSSSTGQWTYVSGTFDGSTVRLYEQGILAATQVASGTYGGNGHESTIGAYPNNTSNTGLNGTLDEVHIANAARSADWIATEYSNQSLPGNFFYVSPTEYAGTTPQPYSIVQTPTSMSYARAITIDHRKVANTDQTDFPVLISGTFPYLATVTSPDFSRCVGSGD